MRHPKTVQQDSLGKLVEEIREYLRKQGTVIFFGMDSGELANRVYWNEQQGGDWKAFLECAQALGAKPIYLYWSDLHELDLLDLVDENARPLFESKVGQTCLVELSFQCNGLVHTYHRVAEWYTEFEALTNSDTSEEENNELDDKPF
jgi:hypothetical protein